MLCCALRLLPSLVDLRRDYLIDPEVAWSMWRPVTSRLFALTCPPAQEDGELEEGEEAGTIGVWRMPGGGGKRRVH